MATPVIIKAIPAIRVISLRATTANYRAQTHQWKQVTTFCEQHAIEIAGPCFTDYYDQCYKETDVDLEVCLPIHADAALPAPASESEAAAAVWGDIQLRTTPAFPRAAAITHNGNYDGLPAAYEALFGWIKENNERPCGPAREVYLKMDPTDKSEASFVTEILQPLA